MVYFAIIEVFLGRVQLKADSGIQIEEARDMEQTKTLKGSACVCELFETQQESVPSGVRPLLHVSGQRYGSLQDGYISVNAIC
jgi:hypothetical protein